MEIQIKTGLLLALDVLLINIKMLVITQGPTGMLKDKYLTVIVICVTSCCGQLCEHEGWVCSRSACSVRRVFPGRLHVTSKPVPPAASRSCSAPWLGSKPGAPTPFQVKPVIRAAASRNNNGTAVTLERRSSTYLIPAAVPPPQRAPGKSLNVSSCQSVDSQGCQRVCTPVALTPHL